MPRLLASFPHPLQRTRLLLALSLGLTSQVAQASDPDEATLAPITVTSTRGDLQGVATSASEGLVTHKQLRTRPLLRAGDIMESMPGLVATQHAGEGKANQYYLRGFNLDHGTDLATSVDGVPVNLPSHGHGQGYTDIGFLIPELVESVQYRKGPYAAEDGDFAAAGAVHIRTARQLNHPFGQLELGGFGYRRALAAGSVAAGPGQALLALEQVRDNGPWAVPQDYRRDNLQAKYSLGTASNGALLSLTHYEAGWTSTDQVPQRAIDSGLIGRFGSLDPSTGGRTRRTGISAEWTDTDDQAGSQTRLLAYALRYDFELFSKFTYYTRGCEGADLPAACDGNQARDQFAQTDRRRALGLNASRQITVKLLGMDSSLSYGANLRQDNIGELGLFETQNRQTQSVRRRDSVRLNALGLWTQAELQLHPQWRSILGLRWDQRQFGVTNSTGGESGSRRANILSPKASLVYSPQADLDLYLNAGRGFHSNDARGTVGTTATAVTPLVRVQGQEFGLRQKISRSLRVTASVWALQLDSELVFVGDAGTTEPSRPSRRHGVELTANWRPNTAWEVDADLSWSHARFTGADAASSSSGNYVPGAMETVASLGVTRQSGRWTFGGRLRHFGSRPLTEDNSLRGSASTLVNLKGAYRASERAEWALEVFNLLNQQSSDTEYAYASRLPREAAFSGDNTPATLHIHPALPRTLRLSLKVLF